MGHGASRAPLNGSEPAPFRAAALGARNGTAAQMAWGGGNGSAAGPWGGAERGGEPGYRHFATAAQLVIFVGSLLVFRITCFLSKNTVRIVLEHC
uniref:Uncharacterized protein n=1 Tax=Gallus gallus TaxID=9031 RepID=A0A8V0ZU40_CHICK